ncbi:hypothetical protein SMA90_34440, partial [Escherichia coli]
TPGISAVTHVPVCVRPSIVEVVIVPRIIMMIPVIGHVIAVGRKIPGVEHAVERSVPVDM